LTSKERNEQQRKTNIQTKIRQSDRERKKVYKLAKIILEYMKTTFNVKIIITTVFQKLRGIFCIICEKLQFLGYAPKCTQGYTHE